MALDRNNLDTSVRPGNDFYQYSNGGWLENNPLPSEYSRYGSFDKLAEDNQKMVKVLIEEASAPGNENDFIARKVGDFFSAGMDTVKINEQGLKPLAADLKIIEMAKNSDDVQEILAHWHARNNSVLFHLYGAPDKKNSEMVIANLYQGGLGMTDVDYYTATDEKSKQTREEYKKHISRIFGLSGENQSDATVYANLILDLETRLANASMTRLERRNPHLTYNKMTIDAVQEMTPELKWLNYLRSLGLENLEEINVAQPEFFREVNAMLTDVPVDDWKIYLKWHLLNNASPFLSSDFVQANFDFYGKYLSGKQEMEPRWKRVIRTEDYALGEAIGQMFVEKHFPPEAKERMLSLVSNLKEALGERIMQLDWMSEKTKKEALAKLESMNVKIGYPDKWRDYSDLEVGTDSYFANVMRANKFNFEYRINKIGKPVDPDEWGMTPQTVNAYYSPSRNEIVFPAGILQPPFFYLDADDAVNYGAIGVVIGHEMTHGFDDQGRQYDKEGNLKDWWTKEDAEKFQKRANILVEQFNQYNVLDTIKADGNLTLGENIADLGGLNIAFTALQSSWKENPPQHEINGFTPEQRFFLAYAHVWAQNITDQEIQRRTKEDVHSLGRFRVNGPLPNVNEFYTAFEIDSDHEMFIPEEERASIW